LVILLPLQFKVNNPAGLVFDTFGDDLFQRGSKDDNSLFDTLKSMRFTLGFRKGEELFTGGKIYLVDESNINKPEEDPLGLLFNFSPNDNHNDGIYLDDAKISLVKDMYPYRLNFLIVPDEEEGGILAFRRNGRGGSIGVTVGLETDDVLSNF
ncbi:MAG: hypothetical protein LBB68_08175, partial [Treponema sp.]|nr:hypothetical protein [Treponema sp.]